MAYSSRPTSMFPGGASLRQPSNQPGTSQQQSSALTTRIASKKAELENLKQLQELSGTLAAQMHALETKIGTLNDGTEGLFVSEIFLHGGYVFLEYKFTDFVMFYFHISCGMRACELGQCLEGYQYGIE